MFGITSAGLNKDIENAIATFTKTVVKLEEVVNKAHQENKQKKLRLLISK